MAGLNETFGGGGRSVSFKELGTEVNGVVLSEPRVEQATDYRTGLPAFYDDGNPKKKVVIDLQTDLREDADDDGKRRVHLDKARQKKAVFDALTEAGIKDTAETVGGRLWLKYTHDGEPAKGSSNPPKEWASKFARGEQKGNVQDVLGQPAANPVRTQVDNTPPF